MGYVSIRGTDDGPQDHVDARPAALATGDRPGAIAALERCLAMLEELGAPPEPATNAIAARLQTR